MDFCLSFNQNPIYLDQVNEIKIPWAYKRRLPDLIERYPQAIFIVQCMSGDINFSWEEYEKLFDECDGDLVLCLNNVRDCIKAAKKDLPYYYGYPIQTYEELNSLVVLDPYYIIPGAPLFFNLEYVASKGIPLKIFPNVCSMSLFPKTNPSTGTWVRPEDIDFYSKYISTCEFLTESIDQERGLYRVYAKDKSFIGPISLLIPELEEYGADNDLINPETIAVRTYCQQKCESGERRCNICQNLLKLANPEKIKYLLEK